MNSLKCPKCGCMTLASATFCKNCSYKFDPNQTANNNSEASEKPQSGAETFCALNLLLVSIVLGIVFCLYWNTYVLSAFLPSGSYPLILLIILYVPAGILALIGGFIWFAILRTVLKAVGFRFAD